MVGLKANNAGVYSKDDINAYNTSCAAALNNRVVSATVDMEGKFKMVSSLFLRFKR
jgi:hypothetical protein